MIAARGLTKRFGKVLAVDDLSFDVTEGRVTGFVGPNGSGKSTTMAMIMGLDRPSAGSVTIGGRRYHDMKWPLREVGGLLEARSIHPGRSARAHLWALADYNAIARSRVDEVLELVGLTDVASKRVGKFSLGMGQRLGIGAAMLGDPGVLLLDEPVNGLDPEGIRWVRTLCRSLASEGRTVFISSHLMAEMALTADQLIVIGRGRLIAESSVDDFVARSSHHAIRIKVADPDRLRVAVASVGAVAEPTPEGTLSVTGLSTTALGDLAFSLGLAVYELTVIASLEDAFMEMTDGAVDYRAGQ